MNISKSKLKSMLFFDIETCGRYPDYETFCKEDPEGAHIWEKKCKRLDYGGGDPAAGYLEKVSLFPEFGQIACLHYAIWKDGEIVGKTITGDNEDLILQQIYALFMKAGANGLVPTGWNIKNFDIPWVVRKLAMHGYQVPTSVSTYEKKPWEVNIIDLKEMWKSFSSLDVTFEEAAYAMGLPSPKDDIDGSQVHSVFWTSDRDRIYEYCKKDVVTMVNMCEKLYQISETPLYA